MCLYVCSIVHILSINNVMSYSVSWTWFIKGGHAKKTIIKFDFFKNLKKPGLTNTYLYMFSYVFLGIVPILLLLLHFRGEGSRNSFNL